MPTFPSSPLRFRTAGFPQYGSKAGLSDGAYPPNAPVKPAPGIPGHLAVCIRRSCPPWPAGSTALRRVGGSVGHCHASGCLPLYPRGPRSGPGCVVPVHHRLLGPIRPTRRHVAPSRPWPVIRNAFAVRERLGDPRVVPRFRCTFCPSMPPSTSPECSSAAHSQFLRRRRWPSPWGK
jgi:hypothetical protein